MGRVGSGNSSLSLLLSVEVRLSVFKSVLHAAQLSPLKRHNDARYHPRGIPHTHILHLILIQQTEMNAVTDTDKHAQTFLICIPASRSPSAPTIEWSSSLLSD